MKNKFLLAACCAVLFVLLIVVVKTVDVAEIGTPPASVGLSHVNQSVRDSLGTSDTWYKISKYLGYAALALAGCFALLGLVQLIQKGLQGVDRSLFVLCGLYAAVAVFYILFKKVVINYRPMIEPGETALEASFPSTHTMLGCVIFGSAVMVLPRFVKNGSLLRVLQGLCIAALVLTVVSRLLSGVHWFSDILGGLLLSLAFLSLAAALLRKFPSAKNVK